MQTLTPDTLTTVASRKTCDGRCQASCKKKVQRCLIIAACGGLIAVLHKETEGLVPSPVLGETVYASLPQFNEALEAACSQRRFEQLVVVGAANDIAWMRMALPVEPQERLVAEIPYPLLPEWLQEPGLRQLAAALGPLIQ